MRAEGAREKGVEHDAHDLLVAQPLALVQLGPVPPPVEGLAAHAREQEAARHAAVELADGLAVLVPHAEHPLARVLQVVAPRQAEVRLLPLAVVRADVRGCFSFIV